MVNYRRNKIKGGLYFFTVTLRNRKSNLLIERIEVLRHVTKYAQILYPFKIEAIVVLPDHIHAIWQLPPHDDNYSIRWQCIKAMFTRNIVRRDNGFTKNRRGEYNLWQSRFWEHTIQDENDFENHVNYIHYNPVKHQLVNRACEWSFSSFHRYVKLGLLPKDWSDGGTISDKHNFGE